MLPTDGPTGSATALTLFGSGFVAGSVVRVAVNGGAVTPVAATYVDATHLAVDYTPTASGTHAFTVANGPEVSAPTNWLAT